MRRALLAILLCMPPAAARPGQDAPGTGAFSYLRSGLSCRSLAMGNAFCAAAEDPSAVFLNPAALSRLRYQPYQLSMASSMLGEDRRLDSLAYVQRFEGRGSLGLGFTHFEVTGLEGFDSAGRATGGFMDREASAGLAWCADVNYQFRLGASFWGQYQDLAGASAAGYRADLAAWLMPNKGDYFAIGLVLGNAAGELKWSTGLQEKADPFLRLGIENRFFSGKLALAADLETPVGREGLPCFSFGAEFLPTPLIALRLGLDNGLPSAGLGWKVYFYELCYAWRMQSFSAQHHFSVIMRF